jgi:site-specific recombinase XerD
LADLDAALISGFLDHLEHERGNSVRTRNARLAALRSFYRFASYRHPEHAASIQQVLAIPQKRRKTGEVSFLSQRDADALVAAPDTGTWAGRRDHALLLVALQTGLRLSELTGLHCGDVHLGIGAHVSCLGKGRKQRTRAPDCTRPARPRWLLPTPTGSSCRLIDPRIKQGTCKSLRLKHVTVHTLRHSCAMGLLQGGVDVAVISMWLGHEKIESTRVYLHADMTTKERALQRTTPLHTRPGRYQPPDTLVAFLEAL